MIYIPPVGTINPSWQGAQSYAPPRSVVPGWWWERVALFPAGIRSGGYGTPFVTQQQFIRPSGWESLGAPAPRVTHDWEYVPPFAQVLASWQGGQAYTAPVGGINAQWSKGSGPAVDQYVTPDGFDSSTFGGLSLSWTQWLSAQGFSAGGIGALRATWNQALPLAGWPSLQVGSARVSRALNVSWQGASPYSRPYGVLPGWWKAQDTPTVFLAGLRATQWGTAFVQNADNYAQTLAPFGQRMTQWGDFTTQQTGEFPVMPSGRQHSAYGQPTIYNRDQYLLAFNEGARYTAFGAHTVHIPEDQLATPQGLEAMQFGKALVAWEVRWVEHGNAYAGPMVGAARIRHRTQTISVPWAVFTQYGTAMVGRHVEITAGGADSMQIPTTHRIKHDNVIEPAGFTTTDRWGWPWGSRSPRVLGHEQRDESLVFGTAHAQLWVRYLQHDGFKWEHEGTKWGGFTHVFNRNRTITVPGLQSFRSQPLHLVENAARALVPYSIEPPGFGSNTFIADRVRFVTDSGFNSFRMSNFGNLVHNAAFLVQPQGRDSLAVGMPAEVASNLQTVRQHSGSTPEFGEPFVADAVRVVAQWPSLNALHRVGTPRISNLEQYAAPAGIAAPAPGFPVLLGPFLRTLQPRWIVQTRHGTPAVRNKTPNVYAWGRPHTEFSDAAWVSFVRRPVAPAGIEPPGTGRPAAQFRTRTVRPVGSLMFGNSPWATQVKNAMPDPPSTRTIIPIGFAPPAPTYFVGAPIVRYNLVRPDGMVSLRMGEPSVAVQGAETRSYYPETEWGGARVSYGRQPAFPEMFPDERGKDRVTYGKPRLSHYTIWARLDTPQQARDNHPGDTFHMLGAMESAGFANSRWPWFGQARVANRHRSIAPYHITSGDPDLAGRTRFGDALLHNKTSYVRPDGLLSMRFAYPVLHPHTKKAWGIGWNSVAVGDHVLTKAYEAARPAGLMALEVGAHRVENWVRTVRPSSFAATQWGDNTPMVHFPRRFSIGDYDATQWGTAWVSLRVRSVTPAGAVMTEMDWITFKDRMSVRERYRPAASGFDGLALGVPAIANAQQFIRPYMIPPPCMRCNGVQVHHG